MVIAARRCPFTVDGLLALADLIGRVGAPKRVLPCWAGFFARWSGGSAVLVDQPADRASAVDPRGHVDRLAWVMHRRVKSSASVRAMLVVVALEFGKDGA